jgi:hypothetical protein
MLLIVRTVCHEILSIVRIVMLQVRRKHGTQFIQPNGAVRALRVAGTT